MLHCSNHAAVRHNCLKLLLQTLFCKHPYFVICDNSLLLLLLGKLLLLRLYIW
jgi:hypothetical protein